MEVCSTTTTKEEDAHSDDEDPWSHYVLRWEFESNLLIKRRIRMEHLVKLVREIFGDSVRIEYTSEYSQPSVMRLRWLHLQDQKKYKYKGGEDLLYIKECCGQLQSELVSGVEGIKKTFVKEVTAPFDIRDDSPACSKEYVIETEGTNLAEVMLFMNVDHTRTITSNTAEIFKVLGIEAAEKGIPNEIHKVLESYGIGVNRHNTDILSSRMCNHEDVKGINRHAFGQRDDMGPLVNASFEKTYEVLNEAARFNRFDDKWKGVTEHIVFGNMPPLGTGKMDIFVDPSKWPAEKEDESSSSKVQGGSSRFRSTISDLMGAMRQDAERPFDAMDAFLSENNNNNSYTPCEFQYS